MAPVCAVACITTYNFTVDPVPIPTKPSFGTYGIAFTAALVGMRVEINRVENIFLLIYN